MTDIKKTPSHRSERAVLAQAEKRSVLTQLESIGEIALLTLADRLDLVGVDRHEMRARIESDLLDAELVSDMLQEMHVYAPRGSGKAAVMTTNERVECIGRAVPAAAAELGITYRQLNTWICHGHVAVEADGEGSGYHQRITDREMHVLRLMARLVRAGIKPAKAAEAARQLVHSRETRVDLGSGVIVSLKEAA